MKVIILGTGGQGAPCASILSRDPEVAEIRLGGRNRAMAEKVIAKIGSPKISFFELDGSNPESIENAARGMDVVIDFLSPDFFMGAMQAAAAAGAHYVNTAWEETIFEDFDAKGIQLGGRYKHDDIFKSNNLTALLGCGMSSGFASNVLVRLYADKLDTVESVKIRLAKADLSIPDEQEILHPWNPGWNPKQALLDFVVPTFKFENGNFIKMDKPFAEPEICEFPEPIGQCLVTHHAHEEPFSIPHLLANKGLKYCDFKYYVNKQIAPIVVLGLGSEEAIDICGKMIKPLDVVLSKIPKPGDAFLEEDPAKFDYLDQTKILSILLEITGTMDGAQVKYDIHIPTMNAPRKKMYETYGTSLISVALPAVIGAKMVFEGAPKGVVNPHNLDPNRFIELLRNGGYENTWEEKLSVLPSSLGGESIEN